jgi:hypothetical protein
MIAYRVGTRADFTSTILARLSSTDFPALGGLHTRSDDDVTVALCDSFATLADVLTFYQERIANESYLRTAVERRSVLELARLIGYQLAPGVAASTAFAFTLEQAPGQPALAARPVVIAAGSRVQSIPDDGQDPQNFETVAAITARVEWNAMPARSCETLPISSGLTELYLDGTATQLQVGDAILIVGSERAADPSSEAWDVRWLEKIEVDLARGLTRVSWTTGLGSPWTATGPAAQGIHVYAFRQRSGLFGHNAPDPRMIFSTMNPDPNHLTTDSTYANWSGYAINGGVIDLDASYPKIARGSWVVLAGGTTPAQWPEPEGYVELYQVLSVSQPSRAAFGLSGKLSRIVPDTTVNLDKFPLRDSFVLAQSDELSRAERPLVYPLYGSTLGLDVLADALCPGQLLAISGKRQRVAVAADTTGVAFPDQPTRVARPNESFIMRAPTEDPAKPGIQALAPEELDPAAPHVATWRWLLYDHDGQDLTILAPAAAMLLQPAAKADLVVSESAAIAAGADAVVSDGEVTTLALRDPLAYCYDRATTTVNANVAPATHGESVGEIAGGGDAGSTGQSFALKQSPLTYVSSASDPSGRAAALAVRVNNLLWSEVPTLYGQGPSDRVFACSQDDAGTTTIGFGDGIMGARLPTGQNNVRLAYRKGLGAAGNLRAGQLTTLLSRALGVKAVTNPSPSTGGQDAEVLSDARANAPLRMLTLDRAVSLQDYADFARSFAGIAKSSAWWIAGGRARGIYLTVAGPAGAAIPAGSDTLANLIAALRRYGDPLLPLAVRTYTPLPFRLAAHIKVADDADAALVLPSVAAALVAAYSFAVRDFGQPVTIDELYAAIHGVAGVEAADIGQLYRSDTGALMPQPQPRLDAAPSTLLGDGSVSAAELLTIDPAGITLGAMA